MPRQESRLRWRMKITDGDMRMGETMVTAPGAPTGKDLIKGVAIIWSFDAVIMIIMKLLKSQEIIDIVTGTYYLHFFDTVVTLFIVWFFLCFKYNRPLFEGLAIRMVNFGYLFLSIFLGIFLAFAVSYIYYVSEPYFPVKETPLEDFMSDPKGFVFVIVGSIYIAPFIEEIYYRGFLFPIIRRECGAVKGIVYTGLWFGLVHGYQVGGHLISIGCITFVGLVLTLLRHKTDSLIPPILAHLTYNIFVFLSSMILKVYFQ